MRICQCGQPAISTRYGRCQACSDARKKERERRRPPRDRTHRLRQAKTCETCIAPFIGSHTAKFCPECRYWSKRRPRACAVPWSTCAVCSSCFISRNGTKACDECRTTSRWRKQLAVPHPQAATIDHIVPISRGGQDVRVNVQLAHFLCNSLKSDRGHAQLLLVG